MSSSTIRPHVSATEAEFVYIAETEQDAEALAYETGKPVRVRRRTLESLLVERSAVVVVKSFVRADGWDILDA